MNITEFKYRYDCNAKDALVLYRYMDTNMLIALCINIKDLWADNPTYNFFTIFC